MVSKVRQWGNSQGVRLPKRALDLANIAVGDDVEIVVGDHQILVGDHQILVKNVSRAKCDLAELVSRIPRGSKAKEICFWPPVGNEEW